jgi:hypothetical protein
VLRASGGYDGGIDIPHLLFADDIFFFCGANPNHLHLLRCLLLCFEAVSGLKINLPKPALVLVGNVNNVESLARILGCKVSSLPMRCQGLPLGVSFKAKPI